MSEERAHQLGYPTDIVVRSYAKTAMDPHPQLLLAPVIAVYQALQKAGKITVVDPPLTWGPWNTSFVSLSMFLRVYTGAGSVRRALH